MLNCFKKLITVFILFFFCHLSNAQSWDWIMKGPGPTGSNINGAAITLDRFLNHIVITGFDSAHFASVAPNSFYVAKYDRLGNLLWQKEFKGSKYGYDIEVDDNGYIYFLSEKFSSVDNQNVNITSPFCLVKLDPNGKLIRVSPVGALNKYLLHEYVFHKPSIEIDKDNNLYFAASIYSKNFQFLDSSYSYASVSSGDVFVAKFDTAGKVKWSRHFVVGGGFSNYTGGVLGIDANNNGRLAITGFFDGSININGQALNGVSGSSNPSGRTPFLSVLDANTGNSYFSRAYKSDYTNNYLLGVILKDDGSVVSCARTRGGVFMLSSGATLWGGTDLVFTSASGTDLSFKQIAASHNYQWFDLDKDSSGSIYASCYVTNSQTPTQNDSFNIRINKYDTAGNFLYITPINNLNIYNTSYVHFKIRGNAVGVTGSVIPRYGNIHIGNNVIDGGKDSVSTFVGSLAEKNSIVTGRLFYDANLNGVQDAPENGLANWMLKAAPGGLNFAYTLNNGDYRLYTDTGTYQISVPNIPRYHTLVPASYSVNFPNYGLREDNKNFALQAIPNIRDLAIDLMPINTIARPGFPLSFLIHYSNVGTTTLSGSYSVKLDPAIDYVSSDSAFLFASTDSLAWSFTNLKPGENRLNILRCKVKSSTPLSVVLVNYAYIYPVINDTVPADNFDRDYMITRGSYDPNDKSVDFPTVLLDSAKTGKQFLEYTIRFQNTGTDTAFQVRILDTLAAKLDLNSFELMSSSHPCQMSSTGQQLEFYFPNILLPDSNRNEAASHGYVKFRIKPVASVGISDVINNTASIYFDYNLPVKTNAASTNFKNNVVTAVTSAGTESDDLKLFPNPAGDYINYELRTGLNQKFEARIYDIGGRVLFQSTMTGTKGIISTRFLLKGSYILEITAKNRSFTKSFERL